MGRSEGLEARRLATEMSVQIPNAAKSGPHLRSLRHTVQFRLSLVP